MRMPRRKTPEELAESRAKSNANLKQGGSDAQFKAGRQQSEIARKGGLKRQALLREQRTARQMLEEIAGFRPTLTPVLKDGLAKMGADPDKGDYSAAFLQFVSLQQRAMKGDVRAIQMWLEIMGQDPKTLLQQEQLEIEREALKQGITGYAALDEAFEKYGCDDYD